MQEPRVSLYEYMQLQERCLLILREADLRAIEMARAADQRAQDAALESLNLRLGAMNEFRKTVEDVIGKMVTRNEALGFIAGAMGLAFAALSLLMKG